MGTNKIHTTSRRPRMSGNENGILNEWNAGSSLFQNNKMANACEAFGYLHNHSELCCSIRCKHSTHKTKCMCYIECSKKFPTFFVIMLLMGSKMLFRQNIDLYQEHHATIFLNSIITQSRKMLRTSLEEDILTQQVRLSA